MYREAFEDFNRALNGESLRLAKESGESPLSQSAESSFSAVSFRTTGVTSVPAHGSGTSESLLLKCLVCHLLYCKGYKPLSQQPHRAQLAINTAVNTRPVRSLRVAYAPCFATSKVAIHHHHYIARLHHVASHHQEIQTK